MAECVVCGKPGDEFVCDGCTIQNDRDAAFFADDAIPLAEWRRRWMLPRKALVNKPDGIKPEPHGDDAKDALNYATYGWPGKSAQSDDIDPRAFFAPWPDDDDELIIGPGETD